VNSGDDATISAFMEAIALSPEQCCAIEHATRGQSVSDDWAVQRKGRITASQAHSIHTRVVSIMKSRKIGKISHLVDTVIHGGKDLNQIAAVQWGRDHEKDGKQAFYVEEAIKHDCFQLQNPGLYVSNDIPFLAASPDYMMTCNCCNGPSVVEIKCPFRLKDSTAVEDINRLEFLKITGDKIELNPLHGYHTQLMMQMALSKAKQGYFVTWFPKGTNIQKISFDAKLWAIIQSNLCLFYKKYVVKCLLNVTPLHYCVVCSKLCLPDEETSSPNDETAHCSICGLYYHNTCINIT